MAKKYSQINSDLENAVENIHANQGISIKPLNDAITELKEHSQNIEKVENNIDAVKSLVIEPIKNELEENKKVGKFSVRGYYIGLFGFIISLGSLVYTTFYSKQHIITNNDKNIVSYENNMSEDIGYIKNTLSELNMNLIEFGENYKPAAEEIIV